MKYLIITTIFQPTKAIKKFIKFDDFKTIVVADKKTPLDWKLNNVLSLDVKRQKDLDFKLSKILPWNNYARKNLGYLYAIKNKAEIIGETDDDNIPYNHWGLYLPKNKYIIKNSKSNTKFINIYNIYSNDFVWPRGFPLEEVSKRKNFKLNKINEKEFRKIFNYIGIIQYLANKDPDVDAIYRLLINKKINFKTKKCVILDKNIYTPFNSQNTFFIQKKLFPLLYLPSFVSIRATDIFRGYIAQFISWSLGYYLMIGPATVYQERNYHNYLNDFQLEIPVYLNVKKIIDIFSQIKFKQEDIFQRLLIVYNELVKEKIIVKDEIPLLKAWISDLKNI